MHRGYQVGRCLRLVAALVAGALLAGCQTGEPEAPAVTSQPAVDQRAEAEPPDEEVPDSELTAGDPAGDGRAELPAPHSLDVVGRHDNGTSVHLRAVEYASTAVTVELEVVNGFSDPVYLNQCPEGSGLSGTYLVDDGGNRYRVSPPEDNETLRVEPAGTLEGRLVFLGRLDRDTTHLTLTINEACGDLDDSTDAPLLRVEFPVERGSG